MLSLARRQPLLDAMERLASEDKHCAACPGHCCTSIANSMQTTPLETLDVLNYLRETNRWDEALRQKLQDTVTRFRLDHIPGNGKKNYLRRTYDCPFFARQNLGCTLPREVKPYGCLGFNPTAPGERQGTSCRSDQALLSARELAVMAEVQLNQELRDRHKLWWDKLPLPWALLEAQRSGL